MTREILRKVNKERSPHCTGPSRPARGRQRAYFRPEATATRPQAGADAAYSPNQRMGISCCTSSTPSIFFDLSP